MPNIYQGLNEIKKAINSLEELMSVSELEPAMDVWGDFVYHLHLHWVKTERGLVNIRNKFEPWQGQFSRIRKKDPLLSYLKNARDCHEHTNSTLIDIAPVNYKHLLNQHTLLHEIDAEDNIIPERTQVIHYYQADLILREFFINGKMYVAPSIHNGHMLRQIGNPFEVGYHGCVFYLNFLLQLDRKFLKDGYHKEIISLLNSKTLNKSKNHQSPNLFSSGMLPIKGGAKMRMDHKEGVLLERIVR